MLIQKVSTPNESSWNGGWGFFFSNANREAFSLFFFVRDFFLVLHYLFFFLKFAIPGTIVANSPIETN